MVIFIKVFLFIGSTGLDEPKKWIIHLEGGAWCPNKGECVHRSTTELGSSKDWEEYITKEGFLSDDCFDNPHFCGWSMVYVRYCDGASFSGNVYV